MKPQIDETAFGSIIIKGHTYEHDVVIDLNSKVKKRKKKLSKAIYGTSHILSLDEAKHVVQEGAEKLIIGSGQYFKLKLSDEAADYAKAKKCHVTLLSTGEALEAWNKATGAVIGLFHVTC